MWAIIQAVWSIIQIIVFVITSLPSVIKALKELFKMTGDRKLARACIDDMCSPKRLKAQVAKKAARD